MATLLGLHTGAVRVIWNGIMVIATVDQQVEYLVRCGWHRSKRHDEVALMERI